MKSLKEFKNESIKKTHLSKFLGGKDIETTKYNGTNNCDVHSDTNNNGTVDAGECVTLVECKNEVSLTLN